VQEFRCVSATEALPGYAVGCYDLQSMGLTIGKFEFSQPGDGLRAILRSVRTGVTQDGQDGFRNQIPKAVQALTELYEIQPQEHERDRIKTGNPPCRISLSERKFPTGR
jgi:hypothetical protein